MGPPMDDELNPRAFPILRDIPEVVVRMVRRHFYAGVKEAEVRFRYHAADEDAVTGALGERLIEPEVHITVGDQVYRWNAVYHKLRGRGLGAPEKRIGADGIFQLEVLDQEGRFVVRKGLLFQSKVDWHGTDQRLFGQARDLLAQSSSSVVIDYSRNGYRAIPATDVVAAGGNRRRVHRGASKSLAEVLGDEFVGCTRGDRGLYWEPEREQLIIGSEPNLDVVLGNFIGTRIERVR
jgi:hypothetical protein